MTKFLFKMKAFKRCWKILFYNSVLKTKVKIMKYNDVNEMYIYKVSYNYQNFIVSTCLFVCSEIMAYNPGLHKSFILSYDQKIL